MLWRTLLITAALSLVAAGTESAAWAKRSRGRAAGRPPEVYSAVDAEDESPELTASTPSEEPPVLSDAHAQPGRHAPRAPRASGTSSSAKAESYDPVPQHQVNAIATRLKLVEAILRKHARAYDYRVHTVRELEAILSDLEARSVTEPLPPPALEEPTITPALSSASL